MAAVVRPIQRQQMRCLNSATAPVLYSARARVVGARTGHIEGDDLHIDLTSTCSSLPMTPLDLPIVTTYIQVLTLPNLKVSH